MLESINELYRERQVIQQQTKKLGFNLVTDRQDDINMQILRNLPKKHFILK